MDIERRSLVATSGDVDWMMTCKMTWMMMWKMAWMMISLMKSGGDIWWQGLRAT